MVDYAGYAGSGNPVSSQKVEYGVGYGLAWGGAAASVIGSALFVYMMYTSDADEYDTAANHDFC